MATLVLDTYRLVSDLKSRGFTEDQARGVTEAIQSIDLETMATKGDLRDLKGEIKAEIAELKSDLFKWLIPLLMGQAALIVTLMRLL